MGGIVVIENRGIYYIVERDRSGGKEKRTHIKSLGKISKEEAQEELEIWKKCNLTPPFPKSKFDVIYADPPWRYDFSKSDSRAIESHYASMDLEDICKLKVPSDENAVLFLWGTAPKIREALKVMESWGFEYKTNMVWVKPRRGMGYYARGQHELLLVGVKGVLPTPDPKTRSASAINAPSGEHSKKPDVFYEIIEGMYPERNYLEMFARQKRAGWKSWGLGV